MKDDERQAHIQVLKDSGSLYMWEPKTDERLDQLLFTCGLKWRVKEVLDTIRYLANPEHYHKLWAKDGWGPLAHPSPVQVVPEIGYEGGGNGSGNILIIQVPNNG